MYVWRMEADGAGAESVGEVAEAGSCRRRSRRMLLPTQARYAQAEAGRHMKWLRGCNGVAIGVEVEVSGRVAARAFAGGWIVRVGRFAGDERLLLRTIGSEGEVRLW